MTKQILLSAFILLALIGRAQDCTLPGCLQQGLVGYWPFCGNANDESGNGNDGVVYGALLSEDRFGNADQSYYFNGNLSNRIVVELTDSIPAFANKTISAWIKLPEQYIHSYSSIVVCDNTVPNFGGTYLSTNGIEPSYVTAGTVGHFYEGKAGLMSNFPLNDNQWHHVVLINNFDSLRSELFIDGVLHAVLSSNNYLGDDAISNVYFGNVDSYWLTDAAIFGNLDDIGIWNRALTPAEITSLYTGEPVVQPVCAVLNPALQNGLVGYWPFCGNANDESGNGNNGVVNGATLTEDRNGNANSAYSFNGINNDITIPNTLDALISNEMTVSMWFNMDDNVDHQSLFLRQGSDFTKTWILAMDGTNEIRCYNENGAYSNVTAPTSLYNAWQQLTAVFTDSMISTYINGVLVAEENVGFPLSWSSEPIILGGTEGTGNNPYPYLGSLDDVGIWNRALTPAEITSLYTGEPVAQPVCAELDPALQNGLVGYWPFCGNANDESGNGNDGVVNGATLTEDRFGNVGSAFEFDGGPNLSADRIICNNPLINDSDFSFSFWLRNESISPDWTVPLMIQGNNSTYEFYFNQDSISFANFENQQATINAQLTFGNSANTESFNNYCFSYDGSELKFYLNGNYTSSFSTSDLITPFDGQLVIGKHCCFLDDMPTGFKGALDDIGIWNRALTAEEVAQLYGNFVQPITYYLDSDGDGYGDPSFTQESATGAPAGYVTDNTDCHDSNANVFPGASCDDQSALTTNDAYNTECACTGTPVALSCDTLPTSLQEGLVGYWPFCGNANDESGNGNDGVVNGATLTEDRFGNVGSAYSFDGFNDYIEIIQNNLILDTSFSISVWLNKLPNSVNRILSIEQAGAPDGYQFRLGIEEGFWVPNDGELYFHSGISGIGTLPWDNSVGYELTSNNAIINNTWQHAVVVKQGFNFVLYLNGQVQTTVSLETNLSFGSNPNSILLGAVFEAFTNTTTANFLGKLDDIGIWNRALTSEEVALLYGNFTPTIPGCTDPLAFNYNPQATVNEGCEYIATIFVFNDLNGNGAHEANEPGLTNWPVLGNDINSLVWTNGNGNAFLPLEGGLYEFTVLNTTDNWVSTTPTSVTIDLTGGPATAVFGLQVIPGEAIVAAGPFTGFWDILHCTEGYESGVYLENIGSQAVSGFMTLTCDPLFTPDADSYFTTPPVEVGPGYALWNVEDFMPGEYELLSFHIDGPGVEYLNQSFTFVFDLTLFDPQGNMIYSDNWSVSPIVACAYDPNDITGFPEGLSAPHEEGYTIEHFILPDNMVEFRVRFQNTGTLPAEDIDIYIPIDPNQWDLSTIFPLMRSAEMQVICLHDDGTVDFSTLEHPLPDGVTATDLLIFSFDDIYLPDSASNPEGSQGYVYFRMRAKHTLNIGDEINAQAFIYFEQNPPIATNETYHVIFDCESFTPMAGNAEICDGESLIFDAIQPYVDAYEWQLNNVVIGSANTLQYPAEVGTYTLELNTKNVLCPQGENHEVTVVVHEMPELDLPLNATVCAGEELIFQAESDGGVTWSNGANTGDLFTADQSFTVTATATSEGNCSTSEDWSVTVNPLPSAAVDSANFVLTALDGVAWQWYFNGQPIDAATSQSYTYEQAGNYYVVVTGEEGCTVQSETVVINPSNVFVHSWPTLHLYPNPMTTAARLELPQGTCSVALYDITGACIRTLPNQQGTVVIERASLASGVYQLQVSQGEVVKSVRLVVE